jgi:hypothetical protein
VDLGGGLVLLRTFGENRPREREKWTAYVSLNRAIAGLHAAVEGSYRFYHDSFGVTGHTVALEWLQKLGDERVVLRPGFRLYQQSEADFYRLTLDGTNFVPGPRPSANGPFYSADYRLSRMRTATVGLKVVVRVIPDRFSVDAGFERYLMSGRDGVTPRAAYVDANNFTVGASFNW